MIKVSCTTCGKEFKKYPSEVYEHNFCCLTCRLEWWGKWTLENMNIPGHTKGHKAPHLTKYNRTKNPMNKKRNKLFESEELKCQNLNKQ